MINKLQYISQQTLELSHLEAIEQALAAGCRWVQFRAKNQPESVVLSQARAAKSLCNQYGAKLIINDFPAVAKAVGADGVHLGLTDTSVAAARALLGKDVIIGSTANTLADIYQRVNEGVDYIGLGPFRFTTTKEKLSPVLGLAGYETICRQLQAKGIKVPIIAIGGIGLADVSVLAAAGVHGIAVSGALTHAADPARFVKEAKLALQQSAVLD